MSDAPLVSLRDLRVDVDGAVVIDHVTFTATGRSLAVWSDDYGFEQSLGGRSAIRSGELAVLGHDVRATRTWPRAAVGVAFADPPLPARWTVRAYLERGAALAGLGRRAARDAVARSLGELTLHALATARLADLPLPERRAVILAQAVVAQPALLVAIAPLSGLAGTQATYVAAVLAAVTRERRWIVTVRDLHPASPEHALASSADQVLGLAGGRLVQHGTLRRSVPPARGSTSPPSRSGTVIGYTLVVRGDVSVLRAALQSRGIILSGGPVRYFVEGISATELLAVAHAAQAPIIELVPRLAFVSAREGRASTDG